MLTKKSGLFLATAAAALFATAPVLADSHEGEAAAGVKCSGVNACKGTSECATGSSSCKGQNACKGAGVTTKATKEECEGAGGKVVEG